MSENNEIKKDLPELQLSNHINKLNLSMIISSIIIGGALIISASTITPEEQSSNIIEYVGGKVEMGKVVAESVKFSFSLYNEKNNQPFTITAPSPDELTTRVAEFFENSLSDDNEKINRNNKYKQERFKNAMARYEKNMESYNKHIASLDNDEQPRYDAPEKPIMEELEQQKEFDDMVLTVDGKVVVAAEVEFNGTITPHFTLELEEKEKKFTVEDKFSLPDLIEFIEDSADNLYSDYKGDSLVG